MSVVGTLAVKITGDITDLEKKLTTSKSKLSQFGEEAAKFAIPLAKAAAIAGAAVVGLTAQYTRNAKEISNLARVSALSVEEFQKLAFAANTVGIGQGKLADIFKDVQDRVGDFISTGAGPMADFFENIAGKVGVTIEQFRTLSGSDALGLFYQSLEKANLSQAEMVFYMEQMASDSSMLIPLLKNNSKEFEKLGDQVARTGGLMSTEGVDAAIKFEKNLSQLKIIGTAVFNEMIETWLPTIAEFTSGLIAAKTETNNLGEALFAALGSPDAFKNIEEANQAIEKQAAYVAELEQEYKKLEGFESVDAFGIVGASQSRLRIEKGILANLERQKGVIETFDEVKTVAPTLSALPPRKLTEEQKKMKEMLETVKLISGEFEREQKHSLEMLKIRNAMAGMTEDERRMQEVINQVLDETNRKLEDISKQRLDAANAGANEAILSQFDEQATAVRMLAEEYAELAKIQESSSIAAQRTFSFGWNTALNQYAENSTNAAMVAKTTFESLTGNMTSAINTFVETGKFSFEDFANSVIKDIIKIQLQSQASQIFTQIAKIVGGAIAGGVSGGATTSGIGTTAGGAGAVAFPVYAEGGYTGQGNKYDPAGVVHKGEYVLNASATRRLGVGNLDRLNKGYADGGYVGSSSGGMGSSVNINIKNEAGADGYKATAQANKNSDGGLNIDVLVRRVVSSDIQSNGALSQQMANTFGLRRAI